MDDYVKSVKQGLEESRKFFGNKNKPARELWVLREFLSYLPVEFDESELSESDQEPNDVFYLGYGFQIKEVLSPGRKRGKEYKDKLGSITENTKPEDFIEQYSPIHIPLSESLPRVASELSRHREEKYSNDTGNIDVLVYLNLSDTTYTNEPVKYSSAEFTLWKSVSLVSNNCAIVLACNEQSNELLSGQIGVLHVKN
ncbi:DUF1780 domain-containing protein [Vibrio europaeus]|uniref:DUF1780 domain-containing protein n=1 Tax=Vibrio europaeus TaxID=300876 RepID=UPI00233F0302|nr:DUF1780 domain-containing protein [Vibrio europaeus]MDC5857433.1 DUF1780 domain-containing protein [Vibrio europaeus]